MRYALVPLSVVAIMLVIQQLTMALDPTEGRKQEQIGRVIVMVASGWSQWPTYPQCETNAEGRFTNVPCAYGNRNYEPHAAEPAEEEVPSWLWKIAR